MTKTQLQVKYPKFTVKSEPAQSCSICRGTGEFINGLKDTHLCMCTCLSGDEKGRVILVNLFQDFVSSKLTNPRPSPPNDQSIIT